jgi:hypothetical protein
MVFGVPIYSSKFKNSYFHKRYAVHSVNDTAIIPFNKVEYSKLNFGASHIA